MDLGLGNLRSLEAAFLRLGALPVPTADAVELERADLAVLPGVGAMAWASEALSRLGLDQAIFARAAVGRPVLGICLGMQLLFGEGSEGGHGLGLLGGTVPRLQAPRLPHMGWNQVHLRRSHPAFRRVADGEHFYFTHSYHVVPDATETVLATTDYAGGAFVAAVAQGGLLGVQFHPERSGDAGLRLLADILEVMVA